MSSLREEHIKHYVSDILHGRDETMQHLSKIFENGNLSLIETLNFTRETFSIGVEIISKRLFSLRDDSTPYIKSLLIFSMELDGLYKKQYPWYTTDMLIQTLVHILLNTQLFLDNYRNKCIILYPCFLSSLFLPIGGGVT